MLIELKNLKHMASLSEETYCYTGTVYVDGKKAFEASNRGHGGCDDYRQIGTVTEAEVNDWLKANHPPYENDGFKLDYDLEMFIGDLITAELAAKERKRIVAKLRKLLATNVAAIEGNSLVTWKLPPTPENLLRVKAKKPNVRIVNNCDDTTFEQVLRLYCPDLTV